VLPLRPAAVLQLHPPLLAGEAVQAFQHRVPDALCSLCGADLLRDYEARVHPGEGAGSVSTRAGVAPDWAHE